jgi:hypothetical protein
VINDETHEQLTLLFPVVLAPPATKTPRILVLFFNGLPWVAGGRGILSTPLNRVTFLPASFESYGSDYGGQGAAVRG